MDSISVDSIKHFINKEDTLIRKVNASIQGLEQGTFEEFLPLIAALAAVLLIFGGQYLIRRQEENRAVVAEKSAAKAKIINLITMLKFHLQELAGLEVEMAYLYYQYETETRPFEKSALMNEHNNVRGYRSERKGKISQAVADLKSGFVYYFECQQKEIPDEISEALKKMTSLIMNYKTMAPYNSGEDIKTEKVRKDVGDLKRVYLSYLGHLESEADML